MCGICGWINVAGDRPVDEGVLRSMNAAIRHRGPDDEGYHVTPGAALAMRRLSIIDVGGGHQPQTNEDGTVHVVFNGEIYNFESLRRDLEAKGHVFRTHSDTEVLVHAYEVHGTDFPGVLEGMFSIALWDDRRRRLILVRDRMGKKPLYYGWVRGGRDFLFGSELKCFRPHPDFIPSVDRRALAKYFAYEYVPTPHSIHPDFRKLEPATVAVLENGRLTRRPYWRLSFGGACVPDRASLDEAALAAEFLRRLDAAVVARLRSDVPLGVFLSGGIDSTTVAALAARHLGGSAVRTFAIGFHERDFDESAWARLAAKALGTTHHEERFGVDRCVPLLPEVAGWLDEPFADASILPTHLLSQFTRQHVTVALGGDGGDELFAGYPTFLAARLEPWVRPWPAWLKALAARSASALPMSRLNMAFDMKAKRFMNGLAYPPPGLHQAWLGALAPHEIRMLMPDFDELFDEPEDVYEDLPAELARGTHRDDFDRLGHFYQRLYMQDDILVKVDRASMAASLEVRAPFLDRGVVEFCNALPGNLKLRGWTGKYLYKQAVKGLVPDAIIHRPKKGFGIPTSDWLCGRLQPMLSDLLAPPRLAEQGLSAPAIHRWLDEHFDGVWDHRKVLWALLMFELWWDVFSEARRPWPEPAAVRPPG